MWKISGFLKRQLTELKKDLDCFDNDKDSTFEVCPSSLLVHFAVAIFIRTFPSLYKVKSNYFGVGSV